MTRTKTNTQPHKIWRDDLVAGVKSIFEQSVANLHDA